MSQGPTPAASYEAAMDELLQIVEQLESDAVSVDDLGARMQRVRELVTHCRSLLDSTALVVRTVAEELAEPAEPRPPA